MNDAKCPTEPRIRQSTKPSDLDLTDTRRISAERLHQQHISGPRTYDFAADDIPLELRLWPLTEPPSTAPGTRSR